MNTVKVKICGIRSEKSALAAINAGADFIGFNFMPSSKRYIEPQKAQEIIGMILGDIKLVGIFQNANPEYVNEMAEIAKLDYVQLHGEEDIAYMQKIKNNIIKKIDIDDEIEENDLVSFYLLDRSIQGKGKVIDLEKAKKIGEKHEIFFAGGLTPENVTEIVSTVKPFAVDVAGGIETNGVEDVEKIEEFIANAKGVLL
ncbi:MAG: phosphoribosylanthranilate isomerase [Patescibacteria group bacterium]